MIGQIRPRGVTSKREESRKVGPFRMYDALENSSRASLAERWRFEPRWLLSRLTATQCIWPLLH
jgi:hypothetical protein